MQYKGQTVYKLPNCENPELAGDGNVRIIRPYRGNEALKMRLRTGIRAELLVVKKDKLTEEKAK